jgi:hypothetical protein
MRENFELILEWLLDRVGIVTLIINILVIFGILTAVGVLTPFNALGISCLSCVFLLAIFIIGLYSALKCAKRETEEASRLVSKYVQKHAIFDIEEWVEEVAVGSRGDATIRRWLTFKVRQDDFWFCWAGADQQFPHTLSDRRKRKVRARAVAFRVVDGVRELGAPYETTFSWENNMHRIFAHFEEPPINGTTMCILFEWTWPRLYEQLLAGGAETQDWRITRKCQHMRMELTFEAECRISGMLGVSEFEASPKPVQFRDGGKLTIISEYWNIDPRTLPPSMGTSITSRNGLPAIKVGYRYGAHVGRTLV